MPPSLLFCPNMILSVFGAFPGGSVVNNPPANAEEVGSIPESGRSPEEGNGNPSGILAWEITWIEEPGGLQFTGSQRVRHDLVTRLHQYFWCP